MKCQNCNAELKQNNIGFSIIEDRTESIYSIFTDKGHLEYQLEEVTDFEGDDERKTFFCRECCKDLDLSEKEVISLLEGIEC